MLLLHIEKVTPKLYNSLNGNIMRNDKTSSYKRVISEPSLTQWQIIS
jgi:hypothetical protein